MATASGAVETHVRAPAPLWLPATLSRGLSAAWRTHALPEPTLRAADLVSAAERKEGRAPAPGDWSQALDILTGELRARDELSPLGKAMAHGQLVAILRQRIRAEKLWRRHPQIGAVEIRAPVVILGQMRSGTTRMHRLLACDPRFAFTRLHETLHPVPASPIGGRMAAVFTRGLLHCCNPQLRHVHPTSLSSAEEEFGLHAFSIHGAMFEAQWHVPRFARWCERRDLAAVYAEFRRLLQTLRWRRGDPAERVQLLKAPQFMQELDALLAAFPDARILRLTRDRDSVLASSASLVWNQQRIQSTAATPQRAAAEWLRKTRLREERSETALARHRPQLVHDVSYAAMDRNWRDQVRAIYRFLGLDLSGPVIRRMERVMRGRSHHGHRYSPKQFGLADPIPASEESRSG